MSHKLIVHIGMPKTGTTAIQDFLFDNSEKLKKYGYCYPDLISELRDREYDIKCRQEGLTKNGVVLSLFRSWEDHSDINKVNEKAWYLFKELLEKHLAVCNVIISDEDLWCQGNNYAILRRLKEICNDMKIICYIRRQDLEAEALWNQVVKRYGYCNTPFPESKSRWLDGRAMKYQELLENFEKIAGFEKLHVRVYEKQQLYGINGDIVEDFLHILGIEKGCEEWIERKKSNERLNGSMLNIKMNMNKSLSKENWFSAIVEEQFMNVIAKHCSFGEELMEGYFTLEERQQVIERFQDENRIIAKRFLGRLDGRLFYDEVKDMPLHSDEISSADMVEVFTAMILELNEKIWKLYSKGYAGMIGSRKCTLFGAGGAMQKVLLYI